MVWTPGIVGHTILSVVLHTIIQKEPNTAQTTFAFSSYLSLLYVCVCNLPPSVSLFLRTGTMVVAGKRRARPATISSGMMISPRLGPAAGAAAAGAAS